MESLVTAQQCGKAVIWVGAFVPDGERDGVECMLWIFDVLIGTSIPSSLLGGIT